MRWVLAVVLAELLALGAAGSAAAATRTNATYFNDAALPAADPYVLHDARSGYYYAYSTDGADDGYHFGIYRSADLVTWEKVPGGALRADDPNQWANDWFWAPEVYYNPATQRYFLFYSAPLGRQRQALVRLRGLRGAVQDRRGGLPLARGAVS